MRGSDLTRAVLVGAIALGVQLAGCSCGSAIERDEDAAIVDAAMVDASPIDVGPIDAAPLPDGGSACSAGCGATTDVCLTQEVACAVRASDGVVVCWGST